MFPLASSVLVSIISGTCPEVDTPVLTMLTDMKSRVRLYTSMRQSSLFRKVDALILSYLHNGVFH